jgi:hypothetical protein
MNPSHKSLLVLAGAALVAGACSGEADPADGAAGAASSGSSGVAGSTSASAGSPSAGGASATAGSSATAGAQAMGGNGNAGGGATTAGAATAGTASGGADTAGGGGTAAGGGAAGAGGSGSTCNVAPIDPDASAEAKKLLCYIYSIYGNKVLSGQQETSWSNPQADIDYYVTTVNKHPAILGGDYLYQDGPKPGGNTSQRAIAYWNAGGLTMMRYHMGAPPNADTYDNSKLSVANFDNLYTENTSENASLKSKLDYLAGELKVLQDAKVPVLMVPYHEVDQFAWFWWSKGTGPQFVKLWKYTIDYVIKTKGVHNALWLMGYAHDGAMADYWPGKAYADLGGIDQYDQGTQPFTALFNGTKAVVGSTIPIPLHETGTIPQPSAMFPNTAPWVLWNVWATYENTNAEGYTWNTPASIKQAYDDPRTVTRESLPSLK